jgi:peptidoglycan/LPS O-acetylase OafA/YrhL
MTPASDQSPRRARIASLDGLRAISIALVLIQHTLFRYLQEHHGPWQSVLENTGPLGVSVFFGISGFIITSLLQREASTTGRVDLGAFYIRRAFRILPPYWLYLAFALLVGPPAPFVAIRNAVLFLTDYGSATWWLGHSWSLSVEEQFYLLWPITLVVAGPRATRVATWLILLAPLFRVVHHIVEPGTALDFQLHTRVDSLMVGCLLALVHEQRRATRLLQALASGSVATAAALFLVVGSPLLTRHFHGLYQFTIGMSLQAVAVGLVLLWALEHPGGLAGRLLNTWPLQRLGLISYGVYLWQEPFFSEEWRRYFPFPLSWIVPIGIAELSFRLVEKPLLRVRDRVLRRARQSARERLDDAGVGGERALSSPPSPPEGG